MLAYMADWRQIQARIRKAKASSDAPAQLAELYQRTRDAMVAFELAHWYEKAEDNTEAARWYTSAAERFRRAPWRTKAEEALTRIGAPIPVYAVELPAESPESLESKDTESPAVENAGSLGEAVAIPPNGSSKSKPDLKKKQDARATGIEPVEAASEISEVVPDISQLSVEHSSSGPATNDAAGKKRRRRGRRGGRNRRPTATATAAPGELSAGPTGESASQPTIAAASREGERAISPRRSASSGAKAIAAASSSAVSGTPVSHEHGDGFPASPVASEPSVEGSSVPEENRDQPAVSERITEHAPLPVPSWHGRTRAGEPALASRVSHLESQLRRLLACGLALLDDAEQAPAGPGVLLVSDSDQVTNYYIESCQTLRIGIGNLLRGGRGSKDGGLLKVRMAENLGIAEVRVSRYLKDHCAVRWLQLDEGASDLAHFAIAVLHPVANE